MPDLLNDRYELGDVVGAGGMGAVHRATDIRLGRTVAVKVLRSGPLADETARARMRSEAHLAASIHHPGVAQVFDFEEDSATHGGTTFIVMQFVEGHSLAQLLREQGPMAPDQVMSVVVQVAEGLQAAHEAGIIHRDLKPANIMLTPAGRTVLVDFGIARSAASEPLTDTGALIGTADYMSPEQVSGRPASPQSDLYALGVVAYHCLTGTSPFRRDSHFATALAHLHDDLPPLDPTVRPEIVDLISSLTAKEPAKRPSTAAAVARRAAAIGAAASIDLPPTFELPLASPLEPGGTQPLEVTSTIAPVTTAVPRSLRRPVAVWAGLALLMLLLAFVGIQKLRADSSPTAVPNVVGMNVQDASAQIKGAGMTARRRTVDQAGHEAGEVVKQSPAAGSAPPADRSVEISIASGKVAVAADQLMGLTYERASAALEKLGFVVARKNVSQSAHAGQVVGVNKSGRLPVGSTITLSVAVAPIAVPTQSAQPSGSSSSRSNSGSSKGKAKGKKK